MNRRPSIPWSVDQQKSAVASVQDFTKQLISLSTGVVTFTLVFLTDIVGTHAVIASRTRLRIGWAILLFSILCGLLILQKIIGMLWARRIDLEGGFIRLASFTQLLTFYAGVIVTVSATF